MCGPWQRLRIAVADAGLRYGPAFAVTLGCLSACTFWLIFISLFISGFQVRPYLLPFKARLDSLSAHFFPALETGGPFAVAFVLNKLLLPIKLAATIFLVPYTAPSINRFLAESLRPWCLRACPNCITSLFSCCLGTSDRDGGTQDTLSTTLSLSDIPGSRAEASAVIEMHPLLAATDTEKNGE